MRPLPGVESQLADFCRRVWFAVAAFFLALVLAGAACSAHAAQHYYCPDQWIISTTDGAFSEAHAMASVGCTLFASVSQGWGAASSQCDDTVYPVTASGTFPNGSFSYSLTCNAATSLVSDPASPGASYVPFVGELVNPSLPPSLDVGLPFIVCLFIAGAILIFTLS